MFYTLLFLLLTFLILTHSQVSLHYAFYGFTLWYSKMIPSLLPFMILSGILIRANLSERFAGILHPLLKKLFHCSPNVSYGIIIGFLCGFPMGAKVTADLLKYGKITRQEARFLFAFNNNIGPVYFCSFVIPLLGIRKPPAYLFGMYGIPLLYGILLSRTMFRTLSVEGAYSCEKSYAISGMLSAQTASETSILTAIDDSIKAAVQSILSLCGYMILFNTLNLLPHYLLPKLHIYLAPLLEITGGLSMLGNTQPLYSLCMLVFGGLSCIAQTNGMVMGTGLSIKEYIVHKLILTVLTFIYYTILIYLGLCGF